MANIKTPNRCWNRHSEILIPYSRKYLWTQFCKSLKFLPEWNFSDLYFCDSLAGQQLQVTSINVCGHKLLYIAFFSQKSKTFSHKISHHTVGSLHTSIQTACAATVASASAQWQRWTIWWAFAMTFMPPQHTQVVYRKCCEYRVSGTYGQGYYSEEFANCSIL